MNDRTAQKELTTFFIVVAVFLAALTALKIYDHQTNEIQKLGSLIFSKFIKI